MKKRVESLEEQNVVKDQKIKELGMVKIFVYKSEIPDRDPGPWFRGFLQFLNFFKEELLEIRTETEDGKMKEDDGKWSKRHVLDIALSNESKLHKAKKVYSEAAELCKWVNFPDKNVRVRDSDIFCPPSSLVMTHSLWLILEMWDEMSSIPSKLKSKK